MSLLSELVIKSQQKIMVVQVTSMEVYPNRIVFLNASSGGFVVNADNTFTSLAQNGSKTPFEYVIFNDLVVKTYKGLYDKIMGEINITTLR